MAVALSNGSAIPFQVEGKDYCVLKDSLEREGDDPLYQGIWFRFVE
jgi:hypothetical protein